MDGLAFYGSTLQMSSGGVVSMPVGHSSERQTALLFLRGRSLLNEYFDRKKRTTKSPHKNTKRGDKVCLNVMKTGTKKNQPS